MQYKHLFKVLPIAAAVAAASSAAVASFDPSAGFVPVTIGGQVTPEAKIEDEDITLSCAFSDSSPIEISFNEEVDAAAPTESADVSITCANASENGKDADNGSGGKKVVNGSYKLSTSAFGVQQSSTDGSPRSSGGATNNYFVYIADAPFGPSENAPLEPKLDYSQGRGQAEIEYRVVNSDGPGRLLQPDGIVTVTGAGFGVDVIDVAKVNELGADAEGKFTVGLNFTLNGLDEDGKPTATAPDKSGDIYVSQLEQPALYLWKGDDGANDISVPDLPEFPPS